METVEKGVKTRKKRTADAWEALSDRTRREILSMLKHRPHTAGEIADQFELSGATVSHHLSVLRESGLVVYERRAQTLIYSLNKPAFREVADEIAFFLKK